MMITGICIECKEYVEFYAPSEYEGPTFCEHCQCVDTIKEEDE